MPRSHALTPSLIHGLSTRLRGTSASIASPARHACAGLSPELADLFRGVFGGGGKEPDEYADDPECFSVERIITSDWFQKHLPGSGLAPLMAEQGSLNDDIKQRRSLLTQKLRAVQEATEEHAGQPMEGWLHLFNVQLEPPAESVFESAPPRNAFRWLWPPGGIRQCMCWNF